MKTLNEFDWKDNVTIFDGDITGVDDKEIKSQLKQSAIEWINELEECNIDSEISKKFLGRYGMYDPTEIINWIKHFFGIKEGDLK